MIRVTLRNKKIKNNQSSLYLDFYPAVRLKTGKTTRREFLKLYVYTKPKNAAQKRHNSEMEEIGELIRSKKIVEIASGEYSIKRHRENKDFLKFFAGLIEQKKESTSASNTRTWNKTLAHLKKCSKGRVSFNELEEFAEGFRRHLKCVGPNTQALYFSKFRAGLSIAVKKETVG